MAEMKNLVQVIKPEFYCIERKVFTIREMKKNSSIQKIFLLFQKLLPDHPSLDNTEIHFLYNGEEVDMYWVCKHFENAGADSLAAISAFLNHLRYEFSKVNEGRLVYLDDNWEKLVLGVYEITNEPMTGVFKQSDWKK